MESNPTPTSDVLVVTGGDPWSGPLPRLGNSILQVIAADSGVDLAIALGLPVAVVIGDLDSASPAAVAEAQRMGARIDRHPKDKDATDLELALDLARDEGATQVVVLGGSGGRMSHFLANAALLSSDKYAAMSIRWLFPGAEIHVVNNRRPVVIRGETGDLISLIPMGGTSRGIRGNNLRWPLANDTLSSAGTRGVSNELTSDHSEISLDEGTVLAVHERPPS